MKKEQIGIVALLLILSGCGGRKAEKQTRYSHAQGKDVLSELDIDDETSLRNFFDETESDMFSGSEFIGWAEEKEVLDLDDFYDLSGTTYAHAEEQAGEDHSDDIVVALEETLADSLDDLGEDSREPVQTALDIDYEPQRVDRELVQEDDNGSEKADIPL